MPKPNNQRFKSFSTAFSRFFSALGHPVVVLELVFIAGLILIGSGVFVVFGAGWSMIALGVVMLSIVAVFLPRRGGKN